MSRLTAPRVIVLAVSVVAALFLLMIFGILESRAFGPIGFLGFGLFGLMAIVMQVLFWAAIIAGGIWLAREMGLLKSLGQGRTKDDALALLDRRYASGEISRSEYFQVKQDLEAGS